MEAVTNGKELLFINRPRAYQKPKHGLTPSQVRWCEQHLKAFGWPKVEARKS